MAFLSARKSAFARRGDEEEDEDEETGEERHDDDDDDDDDDLSSRSASTLNTSGSEEEGEEGGEELEPEVMLAASSKRGRPTKSAVAANAAASNVEKKRGKRKLETQGGSSDDERSSQPLKKPRRPSDASALALVNSTAQTAESEVRTNQNIALAIDDVLAASEVGLRIEEIVRRLKSRRIQEAEGDSLQLRVQNVLGDAEFIKRWKKTGTRYTLPPLRRSQMDAPISRLAQLLQDPARMSLMRALGLKLNPDQSIGEVCAALLEGSALTQRLLDLKPVVTSGTLNDFLSRLADCRAILSQGTSSRAWLSGATLSSDRNSLRIQDRCWMSADISRGTSARPLAAINLVDDEPLFFPDNFRWCAESTWSAQARKAAPLQAPSSQPDTEVDFGEFLVPCTCEACHLEASNCQCALAQVDVTRAALGEETVPHIRYSDGRLLEIGPGRVPPIVECNQLCCCGPKCENRVVQHYLNPEHPLYVGTGCAFDVAIFKTTDRGWGMRTLEFIPKGSFVIRYVGEHVLEDEADARGVEYDKKGLSFLFDIDFDRGTHDGGFARLTIDATYEANAARYINHSCSPNLTVVGVVTGVQDWSTAKVCFFSTQDILKGEELLIDVSCFGIRDWRRPFPRTRKRNKANTT